MAINPQAKSLLCGILIGLFLPMTFMGGVIYGKAGKPRYEPHGSFIIDTKTGEAKRIADALTKKTVASTNFNPDAFLREREVIVPPKGYVLEEPNKKNSKYPVIRDEFGGILVEEPKRNEFGDVLVEDK